MYCFRGIDPVVTPSYTPAMGHFYVTAELRIALEGREAPTICFIANREPVLGMVALEILRFAVDPVSPRLVSTKTFAKASATVAVPA